ncbi:MAG: hypothetical protein RQ729_10785 [Wenzhouxiangellaceae bacterium]|nr:hypothetical protein [Wenzhouxiangellaceae bacterium]
MSAGFVRLQNAENAMLGPLLAGAGVDWVLELAPLSGGAPALGVPRHRMLMDENGWAWPCRAPAAALPFADEQLPAIVLRHLFWRAFGPELLADAVRCLKPGGLLVSVSANPWHRKSWQELGRRALHLPAWPRLLMQHARHSLLLQVPATAHWQGIVPGVAPLLLVVARKPPRGPRVRALRFPARAQTMTHSVPTSCRAA